MHDRAALAASSRRAKRGQVVVIASGKGGVGKTNLALNLSIDLARRGNRVILLDADFGLANADILLNVAPLADFSDLLNSARPVSELLVEGPHGLRLLCGVSGLTRSGKPLVLGSGTCRRAVERLQRSCDTLMVDCGAGVTRPVVAFALASDLLVVTTTPEPTALADAYATLKLLTAAGFAGRVGVVLNMVQSRAGGAAAAARLVRVAERFLGLSVEPLGCIPSDRHVRLAVQQRVPVLVRYPRCAASVSVGEISTRVAQPGTDGGASGGVWARLASLFL